VTVRRGLGTNSALALAGDVASKAGALLVVVVAARTLAVSEFALLVTGLAAAGVLASVLDLGAATLLTRDGARGPAERGALLDGLLRGRVPLAIAVVVGGGLVGVTSGRLQFALGVVALGLVSALSLTVLAVYRSSQDLRPEAFQRLAVAALSLVAAVVVHRADLLLIGLAGVMLVTLVPLALGARRQVTSSDRVPPILAFRRAAPIGLLALATIVYYRSGTLALATLADAEATASFGLAASVAFGLLALPNAVTTALLPRLAAEGDLRGVVACARRALVWTSAVAVVLAIGSALVVPAVLTRALGADYAQARVPFAILCLGLPLIAASGVIGTVLLALGRLRVLGVQVAASLVVNLAAVAVLVPALGVVGAALATVLCETVALVLLARASRLVTPGLLTVGRRRTARVEAPGPALS
jgi:O-antigen/teichoic acid export membrane protein